MVRIPKRFGKQGFTLVELMIVVAIIGVLAALAIYGVRRYLASSKTSEAKNSIGAISRGAAAAYERESADTTLLAEGSSSNVQSHALCAGAAPVPDVITKVKGTKYQPDSTQGKDYQTDAWNCIKFGMTQPQYYMYQYQRADAANMTVVALGDLDGDSTTSSFQRSGKVNSTSQTLVLETQVRIANEFE